MINATLIEGAEKMLTQAAITDRGLYFKFADDAEGTIPWADLRLSSPPKRVHIPNFYVIHLHLKDRIIEEIPWDYCRHYADAGFQTKEKQAKRKGLDTFGKRLQYLRREAKLTQEALAKQAGLSRVTIARMESGNFSPRYANLLALAKALGLDVTHLMMDRD